MNKAINFILFFLVILCKYSVCTENFTEICKRNEEILCVNSFRYSNVLALFCIIDGTNQVIKVTLNEVESKKNDQQTFTFDDFWPIPESKNFEFWNNWFITGHGYAIRELPNFSAAVTLIMQRTPHIILFLVPDEERIEDFYLKAVKVNFNNEVEFITSFTRLFYEPFSELIQYEYMRFGSVFKYFPDTLPYQVRPIVSAPFLRDGMRLLVYHFESGEYLQNRYRIHVFHGRLTADNRILGQQNLTGQQYPKWRHDAKCGFVDIDPNVKVMSSTIVYNHYYTKYIPGITPNFTVFYMLEIYDNGYYGLKRVYFNESSKAFDCSSLKTIIKTGNIRDLLCLPNNKNELTFPTTETETETEIILPVNARTVKQNTSVNERKSSKWWIVVVCVLALIIVISVTAALVYWKMKKSSQQSSEREVIETDSQNE